MGFQDELDLPEDAPAELKDFEDLDPLDNYDDELANLLNLIAQQQVDIADAGDPIDMDEANAGEVLMVSDDGEIVSAQSPAAISTVVVGSGSETIDVSAYQHLTTITIAGENATGAGSHYPGSSGEGYKLRGELDLSKFSELTLYGADGMSGYSSGESGDSDSDSYAGDGGGSSAIVADGELILEAGGGGGAGTRYSVNTSDGWESTDYAGGDGGGPGGNGGFGYEGDGEDGDLYMDTDAITIVENEGTPGQVSIFE